MERLFLFLCFLLILNTSANAQIAGIDSSDNAVIDQSVKSLQELLTEYKKTENKQEKVKILIEQAKLFRQYGNQSEAVTIALKAHNLAKEIKDYRGLVASSGMLSTLYRENHIYSKGKEMLRIAQENALKVKDKNEGLYLLGNLKQEEAYYNIDRKEYTGVIQLLNEGQHYYDSIDSPKQKAYFSAINTELMADVHLFQKKYDSALIYYHLSLDELAQSIDPHSPLKGFIYKGMGSVYLEQKDFDKAIYFLKQAETIADSSNFVNLNADIYQTMVAYYDSVGDISSQLKYNSLYIEITNSDKEVRARVVENLLSSLNHEKELERSVVRKKRMMLTLGTVTLLFAVGFFYYQKRVKSSKTTKSGAGDSPKRSRKSSNEDTSLDSKDHYISEETVQQVLDKLHDFEVSKGYLNQDISLTTLAADFGINQRYLSHIINRQKEKDFASYLNDLRIHYIADQLESQPEMLTYKISYLAQLCGFSSHSHFSIVFKKVKGTSPSNFINELREKIV